jgi:hypothetical protein
MRFKYGYDTKSDLATDLNMTERESYTCTETHKEMAKIPKIYGGYSESNAHLF